jgi:peptide/nickel transport system ATP-binding protein
MSPLLEINDLVVHFETDRGMVEAIDGANLTINQGEVVALVGESGCGKTTMARSILNVIPSPPGQIMRGSVTFNNQDLLSMNEEECNATIRGKAITLIPQDPFSSFNPLFTIGTQIWEVAFAKFRRSRKNLKGSSNNKKATEEKIIEMLTRVQLPSPRSLLKKYPHELSGGQRQRIMIAMALLPGPDLVIADEPTTALDVTIQAQITALLRRLVVEQGVSVLYITHDLGVAFSVSDRIVVMYAGQEVESAPTLSFFASPAYPYTNKLLECLPNPEGIIQDIPGRVPSLIDPPKGCRFHPRCDRAVERCNQEKPPIKEIAPKHWVRCYNSVLGQRNK